MSNDSLLDDNADNVRLMAAGICLITVCGWLDLVLMQSDSSLFIDIFVRKGGLYIYIYIYIYIYGRTELPHLWEARGGF